MTTILREQVVARFGLTNDQRDAALARGQDIIVTAGAGSGKTRTLVARYVSCMSSEHLGQRGQFAKVMFPS